MNKELDLSFYDQGRCEVFAYALASLLRYDMHLFEDLEAWYEDEEHPVCQTIASLTVFQEYNGKLLQNENRCKLAKDNWKIFNPEEKRKALA